MFILLSFTEDAGGGMKKILSNKIFRKNAYVFFLSIMIFPIIVIIIMVHDEVLKIKTVAAGFSADMNDTFKYNENIAVAISSRYLELTGSKCSPSELGVDFLVNKKVESADYKCMISALGFINKKITGMNQLNIVLPGLYFYSPSLGLVYLFSDEGAKNLNVSNLELLKTDGLYKRSHPEYYSRLLSINEKNKGNSSTDIYMDIITNEGAYTLTSYVYGKTRSEPLGFLYYDHRKQELGSILHKRLNSKSSDWTSAFISDSHNKSSICITDRCFRSVIKVNEPYSNKYSILVYLDITRFILNDNVSRLSILSITIVIIVFFFRFVRKSASERLNSMTDPLTRLYTREALRYFEADNSSCFILFDLNYFKSINDNYGHLAGDKALVQISNIIRSNIRAGDMAIRLGGDEFLVLMHNADLSLASDVALRISNNIDETEFEFNLTKINLSVSFGVSDFKKSIDESIKEADEKMYRQKNERR